MAIRRFEDLEVWKEGMRLAVSVYEAFDESRDFGFRDQICRSSVSVPSNIAEGYDRNSNKEFIRFLKIARGSCAELRTQLYLSQKLEKADKAVLAQLIDQSSKISAQLWNLIETRKKRFD